MKKLLLIILTIIICSFSTFARAKYQGIAGKGGKLVKTASTTSYKLEETYPLCTITVYLAGTTTIASIYSDNSGSVKANPFSSSSVDASYSFYANDGRYDIKFSGTGITTPYTLADIILFDSGSSSCTENENLCLNEQNGELNIGGDKDASGTDGISLKTRNTLRLKIDNIGHFGFSTNSPSSTALLDFNNLPTTNNGATQVFRFRLNETNSGDFGTSYYRNVGQNTETRFDHQICSGYNLSGPGHVSGEHSYYNCLESRYRTAEGSKQMELYEGFSTGSEATTQGDWRFFTRTIDLVTGNTVIRSRANTFQFWDKAEIGDGVGLPFFRFETPAGSGQFVLAGNSEINVNASTATWPLTDIVSKIVTGNAAGAHGARQIAEGVSEINFFPALSTGGEDMYITVGGSGGGWSGFKFPAAGNPQYRKNGAWINFDIELATGIRTYSVKRSLGANVDDWIEIGTLSGADNNGIFSAKVVLFNNYPGSSQTYLLESGPADITGSWMQLVPLTSSDPSEYSLEYKGSTHLFRLRRLAASVAQAIDISVMIEMNGDATVNGPVFTSSTTSGSAGSITGLYRNTLIQQNAGIAKTFGGLQFVTGTKPTCNSTNRGTTWYVAGGAGVLDTFEICRKDAADAYAWISLF